MKLEALAFNNNLETAGGGTIDSHRSKDNSYIKKVEHKCTKSFMS